MTCEGEERRKNACIETGRRIKIHWPTATENNDERKEVTIVSIQGWPIERPRASCEEEKDEEEEEDESEREGSLEPKNSGDRVLTLAAAQNRFSFTMPTRGELNGTSSLPSASDRARRRLTRLFADRQLVRHTRIMLNK